MKATLMAALAALVFSAGAMAGMVNVNSADAKTIATELKGVGDKTATRIVEERKAHGPFKSADDLHHRVKGVGAKTLEKNKAALKFADK
jgi:competence protein ComEA